MKHYHQEFIQNFSVRGLIGPGVKSPRYIEMIKMSRAKIHVSASTN